MGPIEGRSGDSMLLGRVVDILEKTTRRNQTQIGTQCTAILLSRMDLLWEKAREQEGADGDDGKRAWALRRIATLVAQSKALIIGTFSTNSNPLPSDPFFMLLQRSFSLHLRVANGGDGVWMQTFLKRSLCRINSRRMKSGLGSICVEPSFNCHSSNATPRLINPLLWKESREVLVRLVVTRSRYSALLYLQQNDAASYSLDKLGWVIGGGIEQAVREVANSLKKRHPLTSSNIPCVSWEDIGGLPAVKEAIQDAIVVPLMYPSLFQPPSSRPLGILLYGPPGTGKTLVAKAVASNTQCNFISVKGPELVDMYIGRRGVCVNILESSCAMLDFDSL